MQDKYLNLFTDLGLQGIFKEAQIGKLDRQEQEAYEDSLKVYRDLKNVLDTARDEGFEEGRIEGLAEGEAKGRAKGRAEGRAEGERQRSLEIARKLKAQGLDAALIAQATGLPGQDIEAL